MADYLRIFSTMADYEAYIAGSYDKPNVSYIEATGETIFTNYEDGPAGSEYVLDSVKIADFTGTTFNAGTSYITGVTIPSGVTALGNSAFQNFTSLTSVDIPSGVTSIGQQAFYGCTHLASIDIPSGVTTIARNAFYNCTGLTSVDIPSGVTTIGDAAFRDCTSLTSFVIPSGLTLISTEMLRSTAITSIDIPSTVTIIGQSAFRDCTSLTSVTVNATTPPTLQLNVFTNTSANLVIYVPAESVETYKAASGWSTYASQIQAIPSE